MDAKELRASAAELAEAQRVAHIGNWTFDLQTQKVTWSDELYRIFEIGHRDFDGRYDAFVSRIHPDDQLHVLRTNARARLEGASFDIEYRIITLAQQTKIIREVGYASRDQAGDVVRLFGTAQDITERKRAEERLRRSESHLAEAQRLAHVGSWEWDLRSGDVTWSDELYRIFGLQPGEIDVAHEAMSFIHTDDRDEILNTVRRSIITKEPYSFCYRVLRPDGDERIVQTRGLVVCDDEGAPIRVFGATQDVTELTRTEEKLHATSEQLRALSTRLRSAREEEGARIARELHDELGSMLTSLKLDLALFRNDECRATDDVRVSGLRDRLDAMMRTIDQTVDTVRRISSELRPSVLDDLGIVAAMRWQAKQFAAQSGIVCDIDFRVETVDLEPQQSTAVFRVFQEALTNVRRHSQASKVEILLEKQRDTLTLLVRDNGRGITAGERSNPRSLGLLGMQERVNLIGGTIHIAGVDGVGTAITIRVPIAGKS